MSEKKSREREGAPKREEIVYDTTNERVVIGMAIADRKLRDVLTRSVSSEEFLLPEHSATWRALRVMTDKQLEHDDAVLSRLAADEHRDVTADYIEGLSAAAKVPANADWYVDTLRWDATRARVLKGPMADLLRDLKDPKGTPAAITSAARSLLRAVEGGSGRRYIRRGDELGRAYFTDMQARQAAGNFYSSGYDAMDVKLVEGTAPKRTAVVVGLPGSGKSTWIGDFAIRIAKKGRKVLLGCWEMGAESTLDVLVATATGIELERIVQGSVTAEELVKIRRATGWLTAHIKFMDNAFFGADVRAGKGRPTNDRSLDVLEGYIAESGCDVVIMDLWERCLVDLSYDGVTTALYRQQAMHLNYNVFGVIVQQLKLKDVEKRADKRPTRDSIKGTGAFVEVADQIYGIHREAQFKSVPDDSIEVICMKQRKGKANWCIRFDWDPERARITGGEEVTYDPGLESTTALGDVGEIAINKPRTHAHKPGRNSRRDG